VKQNVKNSFLGPVGVFVSCSISI